MSREHRYLDYMSRARYDRENGSLSEPHFPRVMASTIESIIRRIYYTGRNAQRFLASRLGKPRMPGVYILGPAILTWYADLHGAEVELYATAQITVQTLPDNVLLEIFKYHRLASLRSGPWKWYRLAQVCRRWRFIVYTHPRLLDLPIILTNTNPIWETPDFLPADIPVIMWYRDSLSDKDADNIFNTLKNPARICEIDIDMTRFLLVKCASLLKESFPALEYLRLGQSTTRWGALIIPDNFLGNSAPRLRVIRLQNTHFPTLPRLLSTSQNLVSLQLEHIPGGHIFTPQELAVGLSSTPQLKFLKIGIHGNVPGRVAPYSSIRIAPRIRVVLPSLLEFQYMGQGSYLDDLAYRIDTPVIEQIGATFVSDGWGCANYELCRLFAAGEELRSSRRRTTYIRFFEESVAFIHNFTRSTSSPGSFQVRFVGPGYYVTFMRQICLNFQSLGIMHKLTWVEIGGFPSRSRGVLEAGIWLTLLHTLSGVERLYVIGTVMSNVVFTLAEESVPVEGTRKILPALRDLHLLNVLGWSADTGIPEDIERFVAARKLCGLPISVHYGIWRL